MDSADLWQDGAKCIWVILSFLIDSASVHMCWRNIYGYQLFEPSARNINLIFSVQTYYILQQLSFPSWLSCDSVTVQPVEERMLNLAGPSQLV